MTRGNTLTYTGTDTCDKSKSRTDRRTTSDEIIIQTYTENMRAVFRFKAIINDMKM